MTFGIGTGRGLSIVARGDTVAFGIGTGRGLSIVARADMVAFGIGTGTGMSALTCADAAVINRTPKMDVPRIVFFKVSSFSSHTAPESQRTAKTRGPEFNLLDGPDEQRERAANAAQIPSGELYSDSRGEQR